MTQHLVLGYQIPSGRLPPYSQYDDAKDFNYLCDALFHHFGIKQKTLTHDVINDFNHAIKDTMSSVMQDHQHEMSSRIIGDMVRADNSSDLLSFIWGLRNSCSILFTIKS